MNIEILKPLLDYLKSVRHYSTKYIKSNILSKELLEYLISNNITVKEIFYRLKHNISFEKVFVCKYCGKPTKFINKKGYRKFCSRFCVGKYNMQQESVKAKIKQTCLDKYGVEHYSQTQECKDKVKATNLSNHGGIWSLQTDVCKKASRETCRRKYGKDFYTQTKDYIEDRNKTCQEKYGTDAYSQTQECKDRIKETCRKNYGVDNCMQLDEFKDKLKKTNIERYGVSSYLQSKAYKEKYPEILAKYEQTCLKKFGARNYAQSKEYQSNVDIIQDKIYQTQKQNNSFNSSKPENIVGTLLKQKFLDVKSQYKSEVYPFRCDFYIPEKDLYIECHFGFFHNGKAFDKNNQEHIKELESIKLNANKLNRKNRYQQLIYTWTDLDVRKLEILKKNKLNYKIFYTLDEFKDWFKSI